MITQTSSFDRELPLAIYYEHPEWFLPLFAELDRRGVACERLLAQQHTFDPAVRTSPYALVVNRMSPSAFKRGHTQAIFGTLPYLAYLKDIGAIDVSVSASPCRLDILGRSFRGWET